MDSYKVYKQLPNDQSLCFWVIIMPYYYVLGHYHDRILDLIIEYHSMKNPNK